MPDHACRLAIDIRLQAGLAAAFRHVLDDRREHDARTKERAQHNTQRRVFLGARPVRQQGDQGHAGQTGQQGPDQHACKLPAAQHQEGQAQPRQGGVRQQIAHQGAPAQHGKAAQDAGHGAQKRCACDDQKRQVAHAVQPPLRTASAASSRMVNRPPKVLLRFSGVYVVCVGPASTNRMFTRIT